jgi:hypothetical protein
MGGVPFAADPAVSDDLLGALDTVVDFWIHVGQFLPTIK